MIVLDSWELSWSIMASSLPGTRTTTTQWSGYHSEFMRLSANKCLDIERLKAAVVRITDIDVFHQVGQVSDVFLDV